MYGSLETTTTLPPCRRTTVESESPTIGPLPSFESRTYALELRQTPSSTPPKAISSYLLVTPGSPSPPPDDPGPRQGRSLPSRGTRSQKFVCQNSCRRERDLGPSAIENTSGVWENVGRFTLQRKSLVGVPDGFTLPDTLSTPSEG